MNTEKAYPELKEIDCGECHGQEYVIVDDPTGTVIYIKHDFFLSAFAGFRSWAFKDSSGETKNLDIIPYENQRAFCYRYGKVVSLEVAKADISSFVGVIEVEEREFMHYCMTHD